MWITFRLSIQNGGHFHKNSNHFEIRNTKFDPMAPKMLKILYTTCERIYGLKNANFPEFENYSTTVLKMAAIFETEFQPFCTLE